MRRRFVGTLGLIATIIVLTACAGDGDRLDKEEANSHAADAGGQQRVTAADSAVTGVTHDARVSAGDSQTITNGTKSCTAILTCQGPCTDDACRGRCFNLGSATGKAQLEALNACERDAQAGTCKAQCENAIAPVCTSCLLLSCFDLQMTCYTEGKTGTLICGKIYECSQNCLATDYVCEGNCIRQGTAAVQREYTELERCYANATIGTCASRCPPDVYAVFDCSDCLGGACRGLEDACQAEK